MRNKVIRTAAVALIVSSVSACSFFSGGGPVKSTVTAEQREDRGYHLVEVTDEVVQLLFEAGEPSLNESFGIRSAPVEQRIVVGDRISITIFESAPGGLFFNGVPGEVSGARQVVLPTQVVDQDGMIEVPYAGRFKAAGNSPSVLSDIIEERLGDRAIDPQVMIGLEGYSANSATVLGEVGGSGAIALSPRGDRLLTVLGNAGLSADETEAVVRLVRDDYIVTVPLRTIINNPDENIYVAPGDTIFVLSKPQVFNALGAVKSSGQYPITFAEQSIAGALSVAGGLSESLADRSGVFVFRFEDPDIARGLVTEDRELYSTRSGVPIVYQFNMSNPNAFFWLEQMTIRDSDMIYVAHTVTSELDQFIAIISRGRLFGL